MIVDIEMPIVRCKYCNKTPKYLHIKKRFLFEKIEMVCNEHDLMLVSL